MAAAAIDKNSTGISSPGIAWDAIGLLDM